MQTLSLLPDSNLPRVFASLSENGKEQTSLEGSLVSGCLYVKTMWTNPLYRRHGHGMNLLQRLAQCYSAKIIPVDVLPASDAFWKKVEKSPFGAPRVIRKTLNALLPLSEQG